MKKYKSQVIAEFNAFNLHDDTVHAIRIIPSTSRRQQSRVEVDLTEYVANRPRLLALTGCANLSFIADFDVLTGNAFANTERIEADDDEERIRQILNEQMAHLNIDYLDVENRPSDKRPTRRKIADVSPYILFRVLFFGGTLEVIARNFRVTRAKNAKMATAALSAQEVICIKNEGYAASLEPRKIYSVMPDEAAAALGLLRVVDESEEDYLYPANFFLPVELSPAIREALHLTSN